MKAAVLHKVGDPKGLRVEEVTTPEPGKGEALVSVKAAALNHRDVWITQGLYAKIALPVILGGETQYTLRRVIDYCDGWFPRASPRFDPVEGMSRLRQAAAEAERDMAGLSMSVFRAPAEKADLERYAEAGVARAVFRLPSETRDTVLPLLDEYATLMN